MLKGKVVLITGGATGIGKAIALKLAGKGADIAINYSRSEKEAVQTCSEIKALNARAVAIKADVTDDKQVCEMMDQVVTKFGRIDVLVNCAGTTYFVDHDDLEGLKSEHWDHLMATNVKGMFQCCRAAASELKKHKGTIVNMTSIAGLTGLGSSIAYAASKAAAISVTKSLSRVMAPDVRVNSIAPGIVKTRWIKGQEKHVERLAKDTPMERIAIPEDIAEVAYSLIEHAGFVTGQTIVVDGGAFLQ